MNKVCSRCGIDKSFSEFYRDLRKPGAFRCWCKSCDLAYAKDHAAANPEKRKEIHRRYREANPEKVKQTQRRYRDSHHEQLLKRYRKYRTANPEKTRAANRKWRSENPEKALAHDLRKLGVSAERYKNMLSEQGGLCAVCKQPCKTGKRLAVDHSHKTGEIRGLLCARCNTALGMLDDSPEVCEAAAMYLRKFSAPVGVEIRKP